MAPHDFNIVRELGVFYNVGQAAKRALGPLSCGSKDHGTHKGLFVYRFLKLFFIMKNKENKKNTENMFGFFFFILKNTKNIDNIKLKKQEQFSDNIKIVFYVFSGHALRFPKLVFQKPF